MKPLDVDVDGILEEAGKIGKYQVKHFLWTFIPITLCSLHASNYIFTTPEVDYRCRVSECENENSPYNQDWLSNAIPPGDKCQRFTYYNSSLDQEQCSPDHFNTKKSTCQEYIFKDNNTFVQEMNIPCQTWKRTLIGTLHSIGTLLALPLIGAFSDRYGRRHALVVSSILEGALGIAKSFSFNFEMFATLELLEPTFGSGVYTSSYILALELLTPSTRVVGGSFINIYFGVGQVLMGLFAWIFPYWRTFLQVIYAPSLLLFVFYWLSEESIRWLITKFRYQEALDTLNRIAKANGKSISPKALENLMTNLENVEKIKESASGVKNEKTEEKIPSPWSLVLRSRILILRVLKVSVWWITCTFCFYGLGINSAVLPGNVYVNFMIQAAVEIPSHLMANVGLNYFGRKITLLVSFLVAGISLLSFAFIPKDVYWAQLLLFVSGKLFVTMAFNAVYLYTSELFPTQLRHSLLAMCSTIGRIGSILAPLTPLLTPIDSELPSYLFAGCCLISACLMLTSPETLNTKLPETVEEAENITSSKANIIADVSQSI